MKFSCVKEKLERAIMIAERFTGKNVTLPILGNILLRFGDNALMLTATNLEHAIEIKVPGNSSGEGNITVPAKVASALIQSIKDEKIELEGKQGSLIITTDTRDTRVNGMISDDFPLIPKVKAGTYFSVEGGLLRRGLERVIPAVSLSEFKPELGGVFFKIDAHNLRLAATDTFRLAEISFPLVKKDADARASFILPHRVAGELMRVLGDTGDVTVALGENQVLFEINGIKITSRLIEGNFPEYNAIIPKNFETTCFFGKDDMRDAVRASSIFTSSLQDVSLRFHDKGIQVRSINSEIGEYKTDIAVPVQGREITMNFNYRYLLDGLNALHEHEVVWGSNSEYTPAVLRNKSDGSFLYIIMPIRAA